ncbi:MAG: preprotein translocase subunit SecG [SAR324 cluster bacterium]|nr:preprotein translocase subunit SecG [SAR324 cluster bacterium]
MNGLLLTFHIIICLFIVFSVLLQIGRGAELGAAFGSMGQANNQRGQATLMSKITTVMAVLFMVSSFALTYNSTMSQKSSVLDSAPLAQEAPAAMPVAEAPAAMPAPEAPAEIPRAAPAE